jgi:hypothetical protein
MAGFIPAIDVFFGAKDVDGRDVREDALWPGHDNNLYRNRSYAGT